MDCVVAHRAKWVIPITQPAIENGVVVLKGDRIVDAGKAGDINLNDADFVNDHGEVALMPGVINVHSHLELSAFGKLSSKKPRGGFVDWVKELLKVRDGIDQEKIDAGYHFALGELRRFGTAAVGDTGNELCSFSRLLNYEGNGSFFLEILGFAAQSFDEVLVSRDDIREYLERKKFIEPFSVIFHLAAHAVYSTSPEVISGIKKWDEEHGKRMSIHVAEHPDELEFLISGSGPCRDLLEERGQWNRAWSIPECSPIEYLDRLGVLDESTICVHAVFLSEEDIDILKKRRPKIALCPRSNLFLTGELPPVRAFLSGDLTCGIGTDSLASTPDLNLFGEMEVLEEKLQVDPGNILRMSTLGGARVLGLDQELGTLEQGKRARIIKIPVTTHSKKEIYSEVINRGQAGEIQWLN